MMLSEARVVAIMPGVASRVVVAEHYLHRRPPISHAYGLDVHGRLLGVVTYGTPASRHLQMSACPGDPAKVIELNRLWVDDTLPTNSESWFVSRTLRLLPPRIVVSYADPLHGHVGYIYRALSFRYAGWTDMERKTPRFDYIPHDPTQHTREAFRSGYAEKRRRVAKVKYWTTTGTPSERRQLARECGWPSLDWKTQPPPIPTDEAEKNSCRQVLTGMHRDGRVAPMSTQTTARTTYATADGNVLVIYMDDNTQRMSLQTPNGVVLGEATFSGQMNGAASVAVLAALTAS